MAKSKKVITVVRDDLIIHMEDEDGNRKARKIPTLHDLIPESIDVIQWWGEPADGGPPMGEIQYDQSLDRPNFIFDSLDYLRDVEGVDIAAVQQAWIDAAPGPEDDPREELSQRDRAEGIIAEAANRYFALQIADGKPWAAGELQQAIDWLKANPE